MSRSIPAYTVPDAAAYDPLFWFFRSNWDRLWWEWQQIMQPTTLWTFRSTSEDAFRCVRACGNPTLNVRLLLQEAP